MRRVTQWVSTRATTPARGDRAPSCTPGPPPGEPLRPPGAADAPPLPPGPPARPGAARPAALSSLLKPHSVERGPAHRLGVEPVHVCLRAEHLGLLEEGDHVGVLRQVDLHGLGGFDPLL